MTTQQGVEEQGMDEAQIEAAQKRVEEMQRGKIDPVRDSLYKRRNETATGNQDEADEEQEEEQEQGEEAEADAAPEKRTRKIKVNGEELEVDEDEIIQAGIRAKQKETAADARFREVAEKERLLQEREQRLKEQEERLSRKPEEDEIDEGEELSLIVEKLYSGDEEEGREALARVLKRAKATNTGMSPEDIQRIVDEKVEQREQAKEARARETQIDEANTWFSDNYAWVEQDELFNEMAEAKARRLMQSNPHLSPMEIVEQIGQHMDAVLSKVDNKQEDPLAARRERKRQQADTPTAASGRAPSPPEEKPKSRKDVFADIARARGQRV